ncbi:MAG: hypothetical protein KA941_10000 [Flavobacteriales bacterium]|nr:hypothetical protein [Flavobacteriales bacterium]
MDYLQLFTSIIGLFPEIIVLLASILYVRKAPGVDALLMVVGSALTMVLSFGWLIPTIPGLNLFSDDVLGEYFRTLSYGSTGAALLFMSGLFMLVLKQVPEARSSSAA